MQAPRLLALAVTVSASWLPVHDNNGSPVCTVGGTLQCQGVHCECVGTPPTVMAPPCDTTMWSDLPDCYSQCRDSDGACMTYYSCPAGFSKSEMIWTCESGNLASLLGYDYGENVKLLANRSYSRVITSSTYDDGDTWTPSCYSPENYAVGYQTCYTSDPNVGVPTTTTTTTTTTTWGSGPMVWENVGEPGKSACRGRNVNDNNASHYTVQAAQSLEDCKALCSQQSNCTGVEYSLGRCEIWTRRQGIYISKALDDFTCLRYGRPTSRLYQWRESEGYACRYQHANDNEPSYYEVSSPPCLELSDCKARCAAAAVCFGIEFSYGRCEIWLRPIKTAKKIPGFDCWYYPGATLQNERNMLLP